MLVGVLGQPLTVAEATNPDGLTTNPAQLPPEVVDGDVNSKWLDAGGLPSTLRLELTYPQEVSSYEFVTANDNIRRDPSFKRRPIGSIDEGIPVRIRQRGYFSECSTLSCRLSEV